jgi:hypothetical protein
VEEKTGKALRTRRWDRYLQNREEEIKARRKLLNKAHHKLFFSTYIIRIILSGSMTLAGNTTSFKRVIQNLLEVLE